MPEFVGQDGVKGAVGGLGDIFDGRMWTFHSPLSGKVGSGAVVADWIPVRQEAYFVDVVCSDFVSGAESVEEEFLVKEISPELWKSCSAEGGWCDLAIRLAAIGDLLGGESVPMQINLRPGKTTASGAVTAFVETVYTFLWKPKTETVDGVLVWSGKTPEEGL